MGGNVMASNSREVMLYTADVANQHMPHCLEVLVDAVLNPAFDPEELEEVKEQVAYEYDDLVADQYLPGTKLITSC